jgi:alpha-L-rhamnosidase
LDNLGDAPILLPRRLPYPEFPLRPLTLVATGHFTPTPEPVAPYTERFTEHIGINLLGFTTDELETDATLDWNRCAFPPAPPTQPKPPAALPLSLAAGTYADLDLPANLTGFLRLTLTCTAPARLLVGWAEFRTADRLDVYQQETINLLAWDLTPGDYVLESFEAYTWQHLRLALTTGDLTVSAVEQRAYESPARLAAPSPDLALAAIQRAALSTFRQNTVDVFMDCPSRERAGWLADSFFIARAAQALGYPITAETAFLENFLHAPDPFFGLPPGMFPMCYPSDHYHPNFIPQWSLWLVLQLGDYQNRGGDPALLAAFEPRLHRLFTCLDRHLNSQGLLEKLPGWNFVEWSKANDLTHDVNFPTQFLYAAALRTAGNLYADPALLARADTLARTALTLSRPPGHGWFRDRALRQSDGTLLVTPDSTAIAQYSPFFFGLITREQEPALWQTLVTDLGPGQAHPEVHPANLLFGWIMRFDLLHRAGEHARLQAELKTLFGPMAARTGTLWEHDQAKASLCHGFASYVLALV